MLPPISFAHMVDCLELGELEVAPQHAGCRACLKHDAALILCESGIVDVGHGFTIEPGADVVALYQYAQGVPFASFQQRILLFGDLGEFLHAIGGEDTPVVPSVRTHLHLAAMQTILGVDEAM